MQAFQVAKREADSDPTELDVKFRVHTEVSDDRLAISWHLMW